MHNEWGKFSGGEKGHCRGITFVILYSLCKRIGCHSRQASLCDMVWIPRQSISTSCRSTLRFRSQSLIARLRVLRRCAAVHFEPARFARGKCRNELLFSHVQRELPLSARIREHTWIPGSRALSSPGLNT